MTSAPTGKYAKTILVSTRVRVIRALRKIRRVLRKADIRIFATGALITTAAQTERYVLRINVSVRRDTKMTATADARVRIRAQISGNFVLMLTAVSGAGVLKTADVIITSERFHAAGRVINATADAAPDVDPNSTFKRYHGRRAMRKRNCGIIGNTAYYCCN